MISDVFGTNAFFDYEENPDGFDVYAFDQCWDDETVQQLWDEYKILYTGGPTPIMLVEYQSEEYGGRLNGSYYVLGGEDDGHIFFRREHGQFVGIRSVSWLDDTISILQMIKKKFEKEKQK